MRRHLVVLRCGRGPALPGWARGAADFDVVLSPYEDRGFAAADPRLARTIPGQKWAGLDRFLREERAWRGYERIWLPDDDLEATPEVVSRFFDLCARFDAALAAPALAEGSPWTHVVTLRNRSFRARATTFVEIMAPCFRRDALEALLPTFRASRTGFGWGLDDAWARLLGYRGILVVDETPVLHTRPVGAMRSPADREAAKEDMRRVRERYDACSMRKTLAGFRVDGERLGEADPRFLPALLEGYRWLTQSDRDAPRRISKAQALDPEAWLRGAGRRARGPWWRAWRRRRPEDDPPGVGVAG